MNEDNFANVDELGFSEPSTESTENEPQDVKFEPTPQVEPKAPEEKVEEPKAEVKQETPTEEPKSDVKVTNPPTQYEGESEIQFNLRKQIYDAGQAKAMADTEEEKSFLSSHIKGLRKQLGKQEPVISPKVEATQSQPTTEEPANELEQAKKVLDEMGYISKDDLPKYIQEVVQGQSKHVEQQDAVRDFYNSRKDIASNPIQRDALERLVVEKFNITPQSSRQDLAVAMDMAASYLFPKTNSAIAAREAADKREIVGFSSNTKSESMSSNVDDSTRAELKSMGWSDEDISGFSS